MLKTLSAHLCVLTCDIFALFLQELHFVILSVCLLFALVKVARVISLCNMFYIFVTVLIALSRLFSKFEIDHC